MTRWIISHEWTVGELWNMMVEYGSKGLKGETRVGFFSWLLPLVDSNDAWAVGHHLNLHEIYWTLTKISSLLGTFLAWCGSYLIHSGRLAQCKCFHVWLLVAMWKYRILGIIFPYRVRGLCIWGTFYCSLVTKKKCIWRCSAPIVDFVWPKMHVSFSIHL